MVFSVPCITNLHSAITVDFWDEVPPYFTGIVFWANSTRETYLKTGVKHRTDGPAYTNHLNGDKEWWANDKRHRTDGPAIEYADGTRVWYQNNRLHRIGGPAVARPDGTKGYWVNGQLINDKRAYDLLINVMKVRGLLQ